eukprot:2776146-Alexandrium_andersonii.AAC.1
MQNGVQQHKEVALALKASIRMEDILREHDSSWVLPGYAQAELVECAHVYLGMMTSLGNHFHPLGIYLFDVTIKFHYLLHACQKSKLLHPYK